MELNAENYYTNEADISYCSASQFKNFFGEYGCEARALAELKGEVERTVSDDMVLGSYVDCMLLEPDKEEQFKEEHPEMYAKTGPTKGMLKSNFQRGIQMVSKAKADEKFMKYLAGDTQMILTGNLFGVPIKVKMDSCNGKRITDLKTVASIRKKVWTTAHGYTDFITANDYILQMAIYQEIYFQNFGKKLPCYIAALSKEPVTDIEIIQIPDNLMHERIYGNEFAPGIAAELETLAKLKAGEAEPVPCGHCEYCLSKKKIAHPISLEELRGVIE